MTAISKDAIVQLIGQTELSIAASYGEDNLYLVKSVCRDLRRLAGIPEKALIQYDETQRRYRLVTSKKAIARQERKATR